ncbi:hypothetical protein [Halovivax sp.]|uniref:type II toxin-antitoxin system HicB family antitoxin n=1 Tax=Halovivax sp. TaxID=1935978 RepID=UPI0025BBF4D8|nr:hypothetical protein [Halovivax sp.]
MTTDASDDGDDAEGGVATITVTVEDGLWIAEDEATGISSQAHDKPDALRNLAAALETYEEGEESGGDDWL